MAANGEHRRPADGDEPWWTWILAVFAGVVVAQLVGATGWPSDAWTVRTGLAALAVIAVAVLLPRVVRRLRPPAD